MADGLIVGNKWRDGEVLVEDANDGGDGRAVKGERAAGIDVRGRRRGQRHARRARQRSADARGGAQPRGVNHAWWMAQRRVFMNTRHYDSSNTVSRNSTLSSSPNTESPGIATVSFSFSYNRAVFAAPAYAFTLNGSTTFVPSAPAEQW